MRAGIYVAAEVGIISRDRTRTLVLTAGGTDSVGSQSVAWVNAETEAAQAAFDPESMAELGAAYDLCTTGKALALAAELHGPSVMEQLRSFKVT
jgi:hypothetical protein